MTRRRLALALALAVMLVAAVVVAPHWRALVAFNLPERGRMCENGHDVHALSGSDRQKRYDRGATYGFCDEFMQRVEPTDSPTIPHDGVVFFSPHQDDEALFYGADIMNRTSQGKPVYVVLMGLGDKAPGCRTMHLAAAACTMQRDREFTTSVRRMHAIPVILKSRFPDLEGKADVIAQRMRPWVEANNEVHTLTEHDSHPDHSNMGFALASLQGSKSHWHVKNSDELATKPAPFFGCWQEKPTFVKVPVAARLDWRHVLDAYAHRGRVGGYSDVYFDIYNARHAFWSMEYSAQPSRTSDGGSKGCSEANWWNTKPRTTWLVHE